MPAPEHIASAALLQLQSKASGGCVGFGYGEKCSPPVDFIIFKTQGAIGILPHGGEQGFGQRKVTGLPAQQQDLLLTAEFLPHMAQLLGGKALMPALLYRRPATQHFHGRSYDIMLGLAAADGAQGSLCR